MDRREVLRNISIMTGAAFVGAELFMQTGCKPQNSHAISLTFTDGHMAVLNEIGETIIPTTDTPGAKATEIGKFMKIMVEDCYSEDEKATFLKGLNELEQEFSKKYNISFVESNANSRTEFLKTLDEAAKTYNKGADASVPHYFTMMKQLTILGYFTSEIGATQTLRYVAVPGRYDGALPYKKGDRAWAV
jgi:hypothetical protein